MAGAAKCRVLPRKTSAPEGRLTCRFGSRAWSPNLGLRISNLNSPIALGRSFVFTGAPSSVCEGGAFSFTQHAAHPRFTSHESRVTPASAFPTSSTQCLSVFCPRASTSPAAFGSALAANPIPAAPDDTAPQLRSLAQTVFRLPVHAPAPGGCANAPRFTGGSVGLQALEKQPSTKGALAPARLLRVRKYAPPGP